MSSISKQADGAEKVRKDLERALMAREDNIEQLENKLKVNIKLLRLSQYLNELSYLNRRPSFLLGMPRESTKRSPESST